MEQASAPVSLKGSREALLLIATGLFLCAFWLPITGLLGFAGIALGMHDLRQSAAAPALGKLRVVLAVASWCCAAFWVAFFLWQRLVVPEVVVQTLTLCATGVALHKLARLDGASALARALLVLAMLPLSFSPLLLLGFPRIATLIYVPAMVALSVLCLQLHARAASYGRRLARRTA
jgi:hypothetical protein